MRRKCETIFNIVGRTRRSAAPSVTENLASSGTTPGERPSVRRCALIASSPARRATADGCYAFTPPDKQLRLESRDFEARRLRNERSMQSTLVELSCRLLAEPATQTALGGAPYEIHPGERQEALPAIFMHAVRQADGREL